MILGLYWGYVGAILALAKCNGRFSGFLCQGPSLELGVLQGLHPCYIAVAQLEGQMSSVVWWLNLIR